ncbi:MAG TPA: hypothetical protein VMU95_19065 [Trebonia sp.]|nr:hypothetical protein [Trebonia sp.]
MAGGVVLATTTGILVCTALAPSSLAATLKSGEASGIVSTFGGSVTDNPVISQCQPLKASSSGGSGTSTPTAPPSSSTPPPSSSPPSSPSGGSSSGTPGSTSQSPTPSTTPSDTPSTTPSDSASATPSPSANPSTSSSDGTSTSPTSGSDGTLPTDDPTSPSETPAALDAFYAPAATSAGSLCVSLQRSQESIKPGQAAQWIVSAWTENGNVPGATVRLTASPAGQVPEFSFGCGTYDGGSSCNLGAVYSGSSARQVEARITVPAADSTLTSVKLTATESASNAAKDPSVSVAVTVSKNSPSTGATTPGIGGTEPGTSVSQLPVGSLPALGGLGSSSSLSPGGNASGLFPTINPSSVPTPGTALNASARPVADSVALPIGTPVVDAQLVGLAALGVAFLLAATRLSVRRRPVGVAAGVGAVPAAGTPPTTAAAVIAEPSAAELGATAPAAAAAVAAGSDLTELDVTEPPTTVDPAEEPEYFAPDDDDPFDEYGSLTAEPPTRPDPAIRDEDDL